MLKKWFKPRATVSIGIDVGSEYIHVIVIEMKKGEFKIREKIASKNESNDSALHVLKNSILLQYISYATIVTGVSDEYIIKKTLQLDVGLNDIEIEKCVEDNAKSFFPECYFDFQVMGIHGEDSAKIDVEMVVVDKKNLVNLLGIMEKSGYRVNIIDINSSAVERAKNIFLVEEIQSIGQNYLVSLGLALRGVKN